MYSQAKKLDPCPLNWELSIKVIELTVQNIYTEKDAIYKADHQLKKLYFETS